MTNETPEAIRQRLDCARRVDELELRRDRLQGLVMRVRNRLYGAEVARNTAEVEKLDSLIMHMNRRIKVIYGY